MPLYVTLYKFTDQGRKTVKESPKRMRDVISRLEKMPGVKVHQALYTSGRYDIVVVTEAPNGVTFDSPAQIKGFVDKIHQRVIDTDTMPLGNKTGMTEAERAVIGRWIAEGAPLE